MNYYGNLNLNPLTRTQFASLRSQASRFGVPEFLPELSDRSVRTGVLGPKIGALGTPKNRLLM